MEGGGGLKRTKFELIFCSTIMSALTLLLYYIIIFLKKKQSILTMFSKRSQRNFGINLRFVGRYITDRMCSG